MPGLADGALGFGGEESAGASFLRRDGAVWTTDKDGIIMNLLALELTARTGRNPSELYGFLTSELGAPVYERVDAPATPEEKVDSRASLACGSPGFDTGRRSDHRTDHHRTWQRRQRWRPQGRDRPRLVCRATIRH